MSKEKDKLIASAQKLAARGQIDKAIKEYQKSLEIDRKDVKTWTKIGDLFGKIKKNDEAIKAYGEAAKLYTRDGFYSKAIAVYKQVIGLDENRDDIYLLMADLYQRLGMVGDAMSQYQRIASNFEKDGKLKEALDIYKNMAELDPRNVLILTKLAELYYKNNNKKEGYTVFKRALDELKEQNRFEEYVRLMEKLAKADPDNVENLKELVAVYLKRKVYDRAYPFLVKVCSLVPDDLQSLGNLAELCIKLDRKDEAVVKLKELAKAYQQKGLRQKAQEAIQRISQLGAGKPAAAATAALAAAPQEEVLDLHEVAEVQEEVVESGIEELNEAVEEEAVVEAPAQKEPEVAVALTPEQIQENITEADVYFKYGLRDKALGHIQAVLKTDPKNVEALKRLKTVMIDSKNIPGALDALRKIALYSDKAGDWKSLAQSAAEILQLAPDDAPAQSWLKKADAELVKQPAAAPAQSAPPPAPKAEEPEIIEEEVVVTEEEPVEEAPAPPPPQAVVAPKAEPAPTPRPQAQPKAPPPPPPAPPPAAEAPAPPPRAPVAPTVKVEAAAPDFKEEIEEAEFYAQQGLEEEALRVYLEILQTDPSNKQAVRRVKELEPSVQSKAAKKTPPKAAQAPTPPPPPKAETAPAPAPKVEAAPAPRKEAPIEIEEEAPPPPAPVTAKKEEVSIQVEEEDEISGEVIEEEEVAAEAPPKVEQPPAAAAKAEPVIEKEEPEEVVTEEPMVGFEGPPESEAAAKPEKKEPEIEFEEEVVIVKDKAKPAVPPQAPAPVEVKAPAPAAKAVPIALEPEAPPVPEPQEAPAPAGEQEPAPQVAAAEESPAFEEPQAFEHPIEQEAAPAESFEVPEEPVFAAEEPPAQEPALEQEPAVPVQEPETQAPAAVAEPEAPPAVSAKSEGEGLFDLAAELEKEDLGPEPTAVKDMSTSEKYGFEDMFKSFKEGVSKVVADTDASTHYDLGIAYKEMGLCEDAVREFSTALKAGHSAGDCYTMIGLCYTERGQFEKAIEEYEKGVVEPKISDKEKAALFYELGQAWLGLGDLNKSIKMFEKCNSLDPGLRDVGQRIAEVQARLGGAKAPIPPTPSREGGSWESAALKEPEKAETAEEEKKKSRKKITYV
jgi:tetratricopeptide (TPR) repeat protein